MKWRVAMQRLVRKGGLHVEPIQQGKLRWNQGVVLNFPVELRPRWGYELPADHNMYNILNNQCSHYECVVNEIEAHRDFFHGIAERGAHVTMPFWDNPWFTGLDAAVLSNFLITRRPKRYFEIGSGFSTKFARHAVRASGSGTTITSVDPSPRSEIDSICDLIVRCPLESCDHSLFDLIEPGDILFFDGSHRVLQNSDTVVFFLEILPRLKPGVLIHVHDIFLPHDYPSDWAKRVYSEQYLLGSMLLYGADKIRVLFPGYFVATESRLREKTQAIFAPRGGAPGIPTAYNTQSARPSSFWFEIVRPITEAA